MSDLLLLLLAALGGVLLGGIFFGGLWWTVRTKLSSDLAALWFFASLILRTGVALAGFYFIGQGDWRRLVACLLGFLAARFAVTIFLHGKDSKPCA